ncbi:hypothetical protein [Herpetosiphon llansteffanensis]|uniref:hypothetical protein n=1 Tax=Herpetosiphon llansteffanensis TaxID=2094568 RepID=UPI000D7D087D|nr:hypothetical protein [Herpetosiphon llansteffanensis]
MSSPTNAPAQPTWNGSSEQQTLAERAFHVMMLQSAFFPENVPVRQTVANLAAFIASQDGVDASALEASIIAALEANSQIFRRIDEGEHVVYATTRLGYYTEPQIDTRHSFAKRLHEPENPLPIDDLSVVITRTRPALTTIEPVFISDYWQQRSPTTGEEGEIINPVTPALASTNDDVDVDETFEEAVAPVEVAPATVAPTIVVEKPAPAVVANSTSLVLPNGEALDFAQSVEAILADHSSTIQAALSQAIDNDPLRRIVAFGDEYFAEENIPTLSKGDLRRIREYIVEQGEPMPDTSILSDVYYRNPRDNDYVTFRFALNYRLNREKDFEFVGVQGARLWSAKGLPAVGTKRLKTSELGQFYSFLEETPQFDDSLSQTSADDIKQNRQLSRFLSFFEWEYGVLPYDAALKALLPQPLLPEQRTAILRIESPQHYSFYLAELRYPTANRGGWLHGLEDFFKEHLVPGALITLSATDDPSVWTLQYEETSGAEVKLLQQDDKKGRYAFVKHNFYCDADNDLIASQERLPRLKNMKVLTSGERRRLATTAGYVLEQVGQPRPGDRAGFELSIDDLFLGVNVQRPATRSYLLGELAEEQDFLVEEAAVIYFPPPEDETSVETKNFDADDE